MLKMKCSSKCYKIYFFSSLHPLMIKGFRMPKIWQILKPFVEKFLQVYRSLFLKSVIYWNDTARALKEPTYWAAFKISPSYSEDLNIFKKWCQRQNHLSEFLSLMCSSKHEWITSEKKYISMLSIFFFTIVFPYSVENIFDIDFYNISCRIKDQNLHI